MGFHEFSKHLEARKLNAVQLEMTHSGDLMHRNLKRYVYRILK